MSHLLIVFAKCYLFTGKNDIQNPNMTTFLKDKLEIKISSIVVHKTIFNLLVGLRSNTQFWKSIGNEFIKF